MMKESSSIRTYALARLRIEWKKRAKNRDAFDTNEVLEFMRPAAKNIAQNENFSFADIYHEFYEGKEENA